MWPPSGMICDALPRNERERLFGYDAPYGDAIAAKIERYERLRFPAEGGGKTNGVVVSEFVSPKL